MATLDHHGGTSRVRMSALTFPLFPCCTPIPEDKKPWLQYFEADTEKQGGERRHSHLFHRSWGKGEAFKTLNQAWSFDYYLDAHSY